MQKKTEKHILIRLGRLIKTLRLAQDVSQEELAALAGVHRTYIGMVERGEKNVTLITMKRLAHALGTDISGMIKGIEDGE